jgi:isoquinoline 1-oxidoreductase
MTELNLQKKNVSKQADLADEQTSQFTMSRRSFIQFLGAGLLITVTGDLSLARRAGRSSQISVAARIHINEDGTITVMTGKVEEGQGSRAQLTQAAAEELRVPPDRIQLKY